ncbi:hypothetical protein A7982_12358 [Minicystis rosea]|nr:hypothetical protein A7982_12358 [Minicystis rosea]
MHRYLILPGSLHAYDYASTPPPRLRSLRFSTARAPDEVS